MKKAKSVEGILWYLTKKRGGHVHEKGIVTITSKSVWANSPTKLAKNTADFTYNWFFMSRDEPGQWICWDFGEMRIRPTHYTMTAQYPKSWIVEGSVDGSNWTEIDRQTDTNCFNEGHPITMSFTIAIPADCRFIRLSQTDKNHDGTDCLGWLYLVEFFGTLFEPFEVSTSDQGGEHPQQPRSATQKPLSTLEIPMKGTTSLDGIISYLTKKHGGHVHEKGIVTLTSKSFWADCPDYLAKNAADFTYDWFFYSRDAPGQWICWDFGERRIRPTHYTMKAESPKSWIVEGSVDGSTWTEIDRRMDTDDFENGANTVSFTISQPADCRFIRLSQTDKNHNGTHCLGWLNLVEFFGTLSE
jgi:hypothetical protein